MGMFNECVEDEYEHGRQKLLSRLTALEAELKVERAEVDAWRAYDEALQREAEHDSDLPSRNGTDMYHATLLERCAATDAARKEAGL